MYTKDQYVDRGTTWRYQFRWGVKDDAGVMTPYVYESVRFLTLVPGDPYYGSTFEQQFSATTDEDGWIYLTITDKETASLPDRVDYAVEVVFAGGDVKHAMEGRLVVNHGGAL